MTTPIARLIVCEPEPRLAPVLRRHLSRFPLSEARSPALLIDLLHGSPASFVICLTTAEEGPRMLSVLANGVRNYPASTWTIYGDAKLRRHAALLYHAGAQFVMDSLTQIPTLKKMVQRHFCRIPEPELPLLDAIRAKLPWPPK